MDEEHSVELVRRALDRGVNLLDSSEMYGTEHIVGRALQRRRRENVLLSTKVGVRGGGYRRTERQITSALGASLERLDTDYVDIYHLHGVSPEDYTYARDVLLPILVKYRDQGVIRAIGITEAFAADPAHRMLKAAVADGCWEVLMVGFNVINQSARSSVLELAQAQGIGILGMFAVRRALSDATKLADTLASLISDGYLEGSGIDSDLESWLIGDSGAESLTELAYRFCVHEPGVSSVLFGTSNYRHLDMNVDALLQPPLASATTARLRDLFANIEHISGN